MKGRYWTPLRKRLTNRVLLVGGILVALAGALAFADVFLDEPMRRTIERRMNRALLGYTVHVGKLDLHLLKLGLQLEKVTIVQNAHPDPPVAFIPSFKIGVQWRALLRARVVADCQFDSPAVHVDLPQLREEAEDHVPLDDRGWQRALEAIYPLKINELRIVNGSLTYKEEGEFRPLEITRIAFFAANIRNVASEEGVYPSEIHAEGTVFEQGRATIDGHADFLLEPHPGVHAKLALEDIALDYFEPIVRRWSLSLRAGWLDASGAFEYAPRVKNLDLATIEIDGAIIDYIHAAKTLEREKRVARAVSEAAKDVVNDPGITLRIGGLQVRNSEIGFVNRYQSPNYRLFLDEASLDLTNLSNQSVQGTAEAVLKGRFMGTGRASARARFLPEGTKPNFDAAVRIEETRLTGLNSVLRAHGGFDVVDGYFSFYSEVSVRDGVIDGYVKPFFRDVNVYDPEQDREKNIFRKIYEAIIGGLAKILENRKSEEVATVAKLKGRVGNAQASTGEIILGLVKNAFFEAILPGFERQVAAAGRMGFTGKQVRAEQRRRAERRRSTRG